MKGRQYNLITSVAFFTSSVLCICLLLETDVAYSFQNNNIICCKSNVDYCCRGKKISSWRKFIKDQSLQILLSKSEDSDDLIDDESLFNQLYDEQSSSTNAMSSSGHLCNDNNGIGSEQGEEEESTKRKEEDEKYDLLRQLIDETRSREESVVSFGYSKMAQLHPNMNLDDNDDIVLSSPQDVVHHLLQLFSEIHTSNNKIDGSDEEEVIEKEEMNEALDEAYEFTSLQDLNGLYPRVPSRHIRKSWKFGQPTQKIAVEMDRLSNTFNDDVRSSYPSHSGLSKIDFTREVEKEFSFLLGCDSFRLVNIKKEESHGDDDNNGDKAHQLCYIDVVVSKVESTQPVFYDKGIRTINIVRTFRFSLEKQDNDSSSTTTLSQPWHIYNVKRVGFAFHKDSTKEVTTSDI